ncbi:MAG TPA: DinB family protein, partial [Flavobacterium sp.]
MTTSQLPSYEHPAFFSPYLSAVGEVDLLDELEISLHEFIRYVREIPMDKHDYRYAEGKWTIKDIIQHLIDAERIFSYRALRIARGDKTPLPGFEEDDYALAANGNTRTIQELLTEFSSVRNSTLQLFKSLDHFQLANMGTASDNPISTRAIGFIIIGHQKHHQRIFNERYLNL